MKHKLNEDQQILLLMVIAVGAMINFLQGGIVFHLLDTIGKGVGLR